MPLTSPPLDDRNYQQLLREALARIPVHNPEWTNFNDSDPGVTLVQLFAFMTETLLYRANQIPRRNREKFLQLLGIGLRPAAAARGFIVIRNERAPLEVTEASADLDVRAGAVRFRTTQGIAVHPLEARVFYKRDLGTPQTADEQAERDMYRLLYADLLQTSGTQPAFYATTPLPPPTPDGALAAVDFVSQSVDRCLWIALLARPGDIDKTAADPFRDIRASIANKPLTLGVMPVIEAEGIALLPGRKSPGESNTRLVWEIAQPDLSVRDGRYIPLSSRASTDVLANPGLVELMLPGKDDFGVWMNYEPGEEGTKDYPPALTDSDIRDRVVTWIRLRIPQQTGGGASVKAPIGWLDINATTVVQHTRVTGEVVGTGTGEPDQTFALANTPVIPDSLELIIGGTVWTRIDDLLAAEPEVPIADPRRPLFRPEEPTGQSPRPLQEVYLLDPESGVITFGDGAHGARPRGAILANYTFGGGRQGNVGVGTINRSPQLRAGYKVENPLRTWGGDDPEDVPTAEKTIPRTIQHRDRLVAAQDFKDITLRAPGVDIGRVEVLPLYEPETDQDNVPGVVTLLVIPRYDPLSPNAPQPDHFFLDNICRYLQPRRLITTELHIRGPIYRDIYVSVGIEVMPGIGSAPVLDAVKREVQTFLSPLWGGRSGDGYPLNTPVLQRELEAIVARVDGVRLVNGLLLGGATGGGVPSFPLQHLQLPRLAAFEPVIGAPPMLDSLRKSPSASQDPNLAPIPVIPNRC